MESFDYPLRRPCLNTILSQFNGYDHLMHVAFRLDIGCVPTVDRLNRIRGRVDGTRRSGVIRISVRTIAPGPIAVNDREPKSRSLAVRRTGWLCAGLAAATGLYCFSGPHSALSAAGGFARTERGTVVRADANSEQVGVDQGSDLAETQRVERALFESDPELAKPSAIQRIAGWPLKKKLIPPTTKAPTTSKPSRSNLWRSNQSRDPFAEADEEAQAEILATQPPAESGIAGESGFTKAKSNRRRLLGFQSGQAETQDATDAEDAGTATVKAAPESEPEFETKPRTAVVSTPAVEEESEDKLRAMFEADAASSETPAESTARTATKPPATPQKISVASPPKNHFLPSEAEDIQQVSEADANQQPTAVPASEATPLPSEALRLRAQSAQQRLRAEVRRLEQAEKQRNAKLAPVSAEVTAPTESQIPTLSESQTLPEADPFAEPQTAAALPSPMPKLEAEQPARARVDQAPVKPAPARAAKRVVVARPEPAMIRNPEPEPVPQPVATQRPVAQPAEVLEPVIRPAGKDGLPPVQVLANRPIELPAPEGWSAAVKLNARRAARLAAVTGQEPEETVWPRINQHQPARGRTVSVREDDTTAYKISTQSYRPAATPQPVLLDKIEDDGAVRVLHADDSDVDELRDAYHVEESALGNQEPAKIRDSSSEPIVIAEYASAGWSMWSLRLITAVSVLFGLYGMWCCRIRSTDGE